MVNIYHSSTHLVYLKTIKGIIWYEYKETKKKSPLVRSEEILFYINYGNGWIFKKLFKSTFNYWFKIPLTWLDTDQWRLQSGLLGMLHLLQFLLKE